MVAPIITFRDNSENALSAVYDFGTIDTGSSGSNVTWQIWNNWSGSGTAAQTNVASAILSGSANELGLGAHDSGSANHADQSDLPTGSVWVSGSSYIIGSGTNVRVTGSLSQDWTNIYSGSSGVRMLLATPDGKLSGSADLGGTSGSAWVIKSWIEQPAFDKPRIFMCRMERRRAVLQEPIVSKFCQHCLTK